MSTKRELGSGLKNVNMGLVGYSMCTVTVCVHTALSIVFVPKPLDNVNTITTTFSHLLSADHPQSLKLVVFNHHDFSDSFSD